MIYCSTVVNREAQQHRVAQHRQIISCRHICRWLGDIIWVHTPPFEVAEHDERSFGSQIGPPPQEIRQNVEKSLNFTFETGF